MQVLQSQSVVKLYEFDYDSNKPELSDEALEHYGVLGMKWGHRKDKYKTGSGKRRKKRSVKKIFGKKKQKQEYKTKREAMDAKDLQYLQKHKGEFTTNELNEVMNRINTEQRLDQMVYNQKQAKKVTNSKAFKIIATTAISGLSFAAVNYAMMNKEGKDNYSGKKFATDLAIGAGVGLASQFLPGQSQQDIKRLRGNYTVQKQKQKN